MDAFSSKRWATLLDYYIACIHKEDERGLTFEPQHLGVSVFTPFSQEALLTSPTGSTIIPLKKAPALITALRRARLSRGQHFFYAYPLHAMVREGKFTYSPVFFVEVELTEETVETVGVKVQAMADIPEVGTVLFQRCDLSQAEIEEFVVTLQAELAEEEKGGTNPVVSLTARVQKIMDTCGVKPYSPIDPTSLCELPGPKTLEGDRMLNSAAIFISEGGFISRGLLRELEELKKEEHFRQLSQSALLIFLNGSSQKTSPVPDFQPLPVTELNESQRAAVNAGLCRKLSVITGPPGTGKSQVVLNLISSAIYNGQTVLFASKNNRAVDVVLERIHSLCDLPAVLRTGSKEHRQQVTERLKQVVQGKYRREEAGLEKARRRYQSAHGKTAQLDKQLEERSHIEGEIALLRLERHECSQLLPDPLLSWVRRSRPSHDRITKRLVTASNLQKKAEDYNKDRFSFLDKLIRFLLGKRRFVQKFASQVNTLLTGLGMPAENPLPSSFVEFHTALDSVILALKLADIEESIPLLQSRLESLPDPEKLHAAIEEASHKEVEAGAALFRAEVASKVRLDNTELAKAVEAYLKCVETLHSGQKLGRLYHELKEKEIQYFTLLQKVFPAWAVTSLSVRECFPLEAGLFDLLIIDEASQCDIPSILPILYRAKRACVIGDPHQLIHIAGLSERMDWLIATGCKLSGEDFLRFGYKNNSLFALASSALTSHEGMVTLDEHYRSHPDIVGFSNREFYQGILKVFTEPEKLATFKKGESERGVVWIEVSGEAVRPPGGSAYNDAEARRVVEVVGKMIPKDQGNSPISIGVVSPFRAQVYRITRLLEKHISTKALERHSLSVATAHRFQGDERDVIIFSPVISRGIGPFAARFVADPNLFNVAITRARSRLVVVGDAERCLQEGGLLGSFARYVREELLSPHLFAQHAEGKFQSPAEERLYAALKAYGYDPIPQYAFNGLHIDLAIIEQERRIAIEIDGARWHTGRDARRLKADYIRDARLKRVGWEVYRIWAWQVLEEADPVALLGLHKREIG